MVVVVSRDRHRYRRGGRVMPVSTRRRCYSGTILVVLVQDPGGDDGGAGSAGGGDVNVDADVDADAYVDGDVGNDVNINVN